MRNMIYFLLVLTFTSACSVQKPKDFTYRYLADVVTGLDERINIDGYYKVQRECDSTFFSVFMFYPDGLFLIATGTDLSEVEKCFASNHKSTVYNYPSWGVYQLEGDTIKTQTVQLIGSTGITVFRDYLIQQDGNILNVSDYVYPENSNIGHLKIYPSFHQNKCFKPAQFTPLKECRNKDLCPLLKSKWFIK